MHKAVSSKKGKCDQNDEHGNVQQRLGNPLQQEHIDDGYDNGHARHHGDSLPAVLELNEILSDVALFVNLLVNLFKSRLNILTSWEAVSKLEISIIIRCWAFWFILISHAIGSNTLHWAFLHANGVVQQ